MKIEKHKKYLIDKILEGMHRDKLTMGELARSLRVSRSHVSDALTQNKASLERLIFLAEKFYTVDIKLTKKSKRIVKGNEDI